MIGYRQLRGAVTAAVAPKNVFLYVNVTPLTSQGRQLVSNPPLGVVITERHDCPMKNHLDAFQNKNVHLYCNDSLLADRYVQALALANAQTVVLSIDDKLEIYSD